MWSILRSVVPAVRMLRYRLLGGESNRVKERVAQVLAAVGPEAVDVEELVELVFYDLRERRGLNLRAMRQHQVAVAITRSRSRSGSIAPLGVGTTVTRSLAISGQASAKGDAFDLERPICLPVVPLPS